MKQPCKYVLLYLVLAMLLAACVAATVSETPDAAIADSVAATMAAIETEAPQDTQTEEPSEDAIDRWRTFDCVELGVSIQHHPDWSTTCSEEMVYICDSQQYGEGERYTYCVYISQHPGAGDLSFDEFMIDRNLSIAEYLEFTETTVAGYLAYRTQSVGSMMGMMSYFIRDGDRYVEIDLDPYNSGHPWEDQERYLTIFETMIVTLQLD